MIEMVSVARVPLLLVFSLASAGDYRTYGIETSYTKTSLCRQECDNINYMYFATAFDSYQSNDHCAPAGYPHIDDLGKIKTLPLPGNMLVDAYRFTCNGNVTGWEVQGEYLAEGTLTVEFNVWNPDKTDDGIPVYRLVGKNVFHNAKPDKNTRLLYSIPDKERIQVQSGDIVGFRAYNSSIRPSSPFSLQIFYKVGLTLFPISRYHYSEDEQTPETLDPSELYPAFFMFPRISVTVKTTEQPTNEPTNTPTDKSTVTTTLITIVTVSSTVGIVILTVIASVAIYGCYRWYMPKYRRHQYANIDAKG